MTQAITSANGLGGGGGERLVKDWVMIDLYAVFIISVFISGINDRQFFVI